VAAQYGGALLQEAEAARGGIVREALQAAEANAEARQQRVACALQERASRRRCRRRPFCA